MCGIVGILGGHEAAPQLLEALKRLEYRGYDSAGIATVNAGRLDRRRATGKLVNLADLLVHAPLAGKAGIGHTRWATHGAPTELNAHPHRSGPVAVVHNGIIENFRALREELTAAGYAFESETDTEAVAVLVRREMDRGLPPRAAAAAAIARLQGAFALCLLFEGEDDLIIAARKGSPLALGRADGEAYVGSDAIALAPFSARITYLEEGDRAEVTRAGFTIFDAAGRQVARPESEIAPGAALADKGNYRHFMAKEIDEQPGILADALARAVDPGRARLNLPRGMDFAGVSRLTLVACGTAHYACMVAKYWFEQLAGLPVDVDIASEFRYREPVLDGTGWAVFVSQSGETADTLAALRHARGKVGQTVAVINVPTSSIAREADLVMPIGAGPEIGVASTKAFTCQLLALALLALKAGADRGRIDAATLARHLADLATLPGLAHQVLARDGSIARLAAEIAAARDVLFMGRGALFPIALEGALKLKEISYIHAEGQAAGELKHGPIALIDPAVPVIVLAPHDGLYDKTLSNMHEVMARGGRVVLVSDPPGIASSGSGNWRQITLPAAPSLLAPILYTLPMQMLAYHAAIAKGTDVDQPRNLAKSVTVE
jgi:glucosamine--fructose-6-phosphate aminotransferase (isomerizing)